MAERRLVADPPSPESRVRQPAAPRASASPSIAQSPAAESPTSDVALAVFSRANLLIIGADDGVAELVTSVWRSLATPVCVRRRGEPLRLSPTSGEFGTVLVHDVDTLTPGEQRALYRWINGADGRPQIVSTASQSLVPILAAGTFDQDLYYRLNVVTLHLASTADEDAPA